jgi:hypothetical protein
MYLCFRSSATMYFGRGAASSSPEFYVKCYSVGKHMINKEEILFRSMLSVKPYVLPAVENTCVGPMCGRNH